MPLLIRRFFILACFLGAVSYYSFLVSPVSPTKTQQIEFVIQKDQSLDQITNNLKKDKIIRSSSLAKLTILAKGISKDIQAGYFYLSPSSSLKEIVLSLTKASSKQVWVTIPEGLRRQEIALIIEKAFNQAESGQNFSAQDFVSLTSQLEGHLFPETYAFNPGSSTENIVKRLTDQFNEVVQGLLIPSNDLESTTILASLIEREAWNSQEMLEIAGILKKRLQANWPLQIDATIQFVIANQKCTKLSCDYWANNISKNDLETLSPYNTYKYIGLPPGPIANPGLEAIQASFKAVSSDYWFYLHDSKGQAHFAKTIEEHNQNICLYLKKDCN